MEERFEKRALLGKGATAEVWLVRDDLLSRDMAVKAGSDKELLLREAQCMVRLASPYIPVLYGYVEENGLGYLAMEYIRGENLSERAGRIGRYTEAEVLRIACMTASILGTMHEGRVPVLYGDIKPENIIMTPEGSIRLVDFGTVIFLDEPESDSGRETVRGATPKYAAPEFWQGKVDARSDVYALGKLMEQLLSAGAERCVTDGMKRLIERCVNPQPKYRYASMYDFLEDAEREREKR